MSTIIETPKWEDSIFQFETDTPVVGGPPQYDANNNPVDGFSNIPSQQLANRTQYIKQIVDDFSPVAASGDYRDLTNKPTIESLGGIASSQIGVTVCELVNGTVPSSRLPSYVDDVLEFSTRSAFPATGESGKIYVATDTNRTWRWTGSTYVQIVASPGTTDNVTEGTTNLYFTQDRVRTTPLTGLVTTNINPVVATDTVLSAVGKLQGQVNNMSGSTVTLANLHAVALSF